MRIEQKTIKERLDMELTPKEAKPMIDKKEILKHPITIVIIVGVSIYGFLHVSKHFVRAYAGLVKAVHNARHDLRR
ncbi:hypothetical protein [Kordia sp.]|uniref:hypothetical protein n=1 Tax=Kordia sp. TaxID=1965332 RepID=UPI003D2B2624